MSSQGGIEFGIEIFPGGKLLLKFIDNGKGRTKFPKSPNTRGRFSSGKKVRINEILQTIAYVLFVGMSQKSKFPDMA